MSATVKEVVVVLEIHRAGARWAASTALGDNPICCYGVSPTDAEARAKGAVFRLLGNVVERGHAEIEAIRFKVRR